MDRVELRTSNTSEEFTVWVHLLVPKSEYGTSSGKS